MNEIQHYEVPRSIAEATEILARGDATILAGGTDLMVQGESGRVQYRSTLINIRRVAEMQGVNQEDGYVHIGALTTITELERDPIIKGKFPLLVRAADVFASPQIRNAGTIGGNICNASPAGDTLIPLIVLNAEVELASYSDGGVKVRRLPIQDFFDRPGKTHRTSAELLTGVRIPIPPEGFVAEFEKFGTRPALDISTVSVAVGGVRNGQTLTDVRVAFGAVAPVPYRAESTAAAIEGKSLDEETIDSVGRTAQQEVHPIDDVRASAWYRSELIANLTKKVLRHVAQA